MIHYLHTIEKMVDLFGYIFSDIHIRRWDSEKKNKQDLLVPIEFNGKERMFYLINNKMKDNNIKIDSVFPRIGYSLKDIFYDSTRMLNRDVKISSTYGEEGNTEIECNRLPYNFKFQLDIAAVHKSDLFMILEQILPWFRPSLVLQAKLNEFVGDDKVSIPIVLNSTLFNDLNDESPFSDNPDKPYIYSLDFTVKAWLYQLNNEGPDGSYPGASGVGKTIKEIELGVVNWNDTREVTDPSLYTIHYPEHIESNESN